MSFSVCMIVSSCAKWLPFTVGQIAPHAKEVIIIEGATQEMVDLGLAKPDGSSIDDTAEVIQLLKLEFGNIKHKPARIYKHRNEQRNAYLPMVTGDWIWIVDHDEFYDEATILRVMEAMKNPKRRCVVTRFLRYYAWTRRFKEIDPAMERIFRAEPGLTYPDINSGQYVLTATGEKMWDFAWELRDAYCHHYNRVLDPSDIIVKLLYYAKRDYNISPRALIAQQHEQQSFKKLALDGVYVPLEDQPLQARGLMMAGIAPLTSVLSQMDSRQGGMEWQRELEESVL